MKRTKHENGYCGWHEKPSDRYIGTWESFQQLLTEGHAIPDYEMQSYMADCYEMNNGLADDVPGQTFVSFEVWDMICESLFNEKVERCREQMDASMILRRGDIVVNPALWR